MKKTVVAVFAHPDDESFGPGGTLAQLSLTNDVYIITLTGGEAGKNSLDKDEEKLSDIRKEELLESAKILGVKKVFFMEFVDGTLSNSIYHEIASKVQEQLEILQPDIVITFEAGGGSGHLDHIATHYITTFVVKKLAKTPELWYYFTPLSHKTLPDDYFVCPPVAHPLSDADKTIDTTEVWEIKKKAMLAHASQAHDAIRILERIEKLPKKEFFQLYKK